MHHKLRFLLLQVRNADDPMRASEIRSFARALTCSPEQIATHDLLAGPPTIGQLNQVDAALLGGSGDYSVAEGGPWLERALDGMRELYELAKPTFASCWGFQAMARALGGQVVTDLSRAEVGTHELNLTEAGRDDPLFAPLGESFLAQMGHQDIVDSLPADAVLLASSAPVVNQAFRLADKPIYCTQFHAELNRADLLERVRAYPQYMERIAGVSQQAIMSQCRDTPQSEQLLLRFVEHVFPDTFR